MGAYFLDTSALMKRYVQREKGYAWMVDICDPQQGHDLIIAEVALVEAVASFCRMARETPPRLSPAQRDRLITLFQQHTRRHYTITALTRTILSHAGELCRSHPLRAYDAMQLASALHVSNKAHAGALPPPTFVCADTNLLVVAAAEGLATENPNMHP